MALLKDWLQIEPAKAQGEQAKLTQINNFINRNIVFENDFGIWQQSDYWATPLETIGQGRGDCEDFAIIKYVSLRMVGIPAKKAASDLRQSKSSKGQTARCSKPTWCLPTTRRRTPSRWFWTTDTTIRPAFSAPGPAAGIHFNSEVFSLVCQGWTRQLAAALAAFRAGRTYCDELVPKAMNRRHLC